MNIEVEGILVKPNNIKSMIRTSVDSTTEEIIRTPSLEGHAYSSHRSQGSRFCACGWQRSTTTIECEALTSLTDRGRLRFFFDKQFFRFKITNQLKI